MFGLTTGMGVKTGGIHNAMTKRDSKCFSFDGSDEYVNTTITGNELMVNDAFTIAAWVRKTGAGTAFICGVDHGAVDYMHFYIVSGYVRCDISSDTGDYHTSVSADTIPGYGVGESDWFFAAGKFTPSFLTGTTRVSLNGSAWTAATNTNNTFIHGEFSVTKNIWLGARNDDDSFANGLNGKISSIMFFDKAISQAELDDLYSSGRMGEVHPKHVNLESNLIAWYRMGDEGSDSNTVLVDASGNGNTGTAVNMESGDLVAESPA